MFKSVVYSFAGNKVGFIVEQFGVLVEGIFITAKKCFEFFGDFMLGVDFKHQLRLYRVFFGVGLRISQHPNCLNTGTVGLSLCCRRIHHR